MTDDDLKADEDFGQPNCETCLLPLALSGSATHPYWTCPECGLRRLS